MSILNLLFYDRRPQPRPRPVAYRGKPDPQFRKPTNRHQLRLDYSKKPLHDQKTDGISSKNYPRARKPVSLARDNQRYKFKRFHYQQWN
jgi:hypothetical protein